MSSTGMPSVMATMSFDAGGDGLEDGVGRERRRHVDDRGVGAGGLHRVGDGVEDGHVSELLAALAGGDAADHVGAVGEHLLAWNVPAEPVMPWQMRRVSLRDPDGHRSGSFTAATIFWAPSAMSSAG
jgi:hypothetical protein